MSSFWSMCKMMTFAATVVETPNWLVKISKYTYLPHTRPTGLKTKPGLVLAPPTTFRTLQ